jgi:hypothetical protein
MSELGRRQAFAGWGKEESRWRGGGRRLVLALRGVDWLAQPICQIWYKIVSAVLHELFQLCFSRCLGPPITRRPQVSSRVCLFHNTAQSPGAGSPAEERGARGTPPEGRVFINADIGRMSALGANRTRPGTDDPRCALGTHVLCFELSDECGETR